MPCSLSQSEASGRATLSRSSKLSEVGFTSYGLAEFWDFDLTDHDTRMQGETQPSPRARLAVPPSVRWLPASRSRLPYEFQCRGSKMAVKPRKNTGNL